MKRGKVEFVENVDFVENNKISKVDAFKSKIEETSKKIESQSQAKWSVLDEKKKKKGSDIKNWDVEEGNEDDWDEDVDL